MSIVKLITAFAAAAILAGCASNVPLTREQVGRISAETSGSDLDAILGKATVSAEYDVDAVGKSYHVRYLKLQTGQRSITMMSCVKTCTPLHPVVPVTEEYVVIQELPSRKPLGWGTIEELSKSPDDRTASIMPKLKELEAERQAALPAPR